jgi:TolB protein
MHRRTAVWTLGTISSLIASSAHAGGLLTLWQQPTSGSIEDAARWSQGVPGEFDSAVFGESPSPTPFDVSVLGQHLFDALTIGSQSPRFIAQSGGRRTPSLTLTGSLSVNAALPSSPSAYFDGVHLDSGLSTLVGVSLTGGALNLTNTEWTGRSVQVGKAGGVGVLTVGPNTQASSADPTLPWLIGDGGNGTLTIESGSQLDLNGTLLRVGANQAGTGVLNLKPGGFLDLDGGTLYVGGTYAAGNGQSGSAAATLQGAIDGPGTIIVGFRSSGTCSVAPGATIAPDITAIRVGDGPSGSGTLNLLSSQSLDTVSIGNVATGSMWVIGASTNVTVQSLLVAQGGTSSLTVSDGATLYPETLSVGNRGGSITALGSTFRCDAVNFAENMLATANFAAFSPAALLALPAMDINGGPSEAPVGVQRADLTADLSGHIETGSITTSRASWARCTTKNGGVFTIDGTLSLSESAQNHLTVGPFGTLTANAIATDASCGWSWVLPLDPTPVSADSVDITGPVAVTTSGGWQPAAPSTIRLVSSPQTTFAPASVSTPTFFGYPALVGTDSEGVVLRATDHIDAFVLPASVSIPFGESITLPTSITLDGVTYDVSDQSTWSFSPQAVVVRTGPRTFFAAGSGTATATVTFGNATTAVAFDVGSSQSQGTYLVSGLGLFYGNNDSGWDGPGLFVNPFGFGPRSLSNDGTVAAFSSQASNLAGSTAGSSDDCFVTDLSAGTIEELTGVLDGLETTSVNAPALSGDGRFVAFVGSAGTGVYRAMLFDRQNPTLQIVSVDMNGVAAAADPVARTCVSDDGRFVAFTSAATNLVPGDTNAVADVFLRDRLLNTTIRTSLSPGGTQFIGACTLADMTADGRYVLFLRNFGAWKLAYRFDRVTGQVVSASPGLFDETPSIKVIDAQVSADGAEVLFTANASEPLVVGPLPISAQLYRSDISTGEVSAVSLLEDSQWFSAPVEGFGLSRSGRFVALTTKAPGLDPAMPDDGTGLTKLYRLDRLNGSFVRVSQGADGPYNEDVYPPVAISTDGKRIGFVTRASNVLPLDTLGKNDVFVSELARSPADLDGDGLVQASDLAILLGAWGDASLADLDGDGVIGAGDIAVLLGEWNG